MIVELTADFASFPTSYPGQCIPDAGGVTLTLVTGSLRREVHVCAGSEGMPPDLIELLEELHRLETDLLSDP